MALRMSLTAARSKVIEHDSLSSSFLCLWLCKTSEKITPEKIFQWLTSIQTYENQMQDPLVVCGECPEEEGLAAQSCYTCPDVCQPHVTSL
jgi:hypothetical protein